MSALEAIEDNYLKGQYSISGNREGSPASLIGSIKKAIDVMERASADAGAKEPLIAGQNVTQIGDYTLTLIEGLIETISQDATSASPLLDEDVIYLIVVSGLWVAQHGGRINRLDVVVNALAGYANSLRELGQLADLAVIIRDIIRSTSEDISRDLEQTNPMRPWRILNLNYGIVATRSHDPGLMEEAYAILVENLPNDAREFFREGMKQMDVMGYPRNVREVVEKYDQMWGADSTLH